MGGIGLLCRLRAVRDRSAAHWWTCQAPAPYNRSGGGGARRIQGVFFEELVS